MLTHPRNRFIIAAVLFYVLVATAWILLSDELLLLATEPATQHLLGKIKSLLFVLASALIFLVVLRAVPDNTEAATDTEFPESLFQPQAMRQLWWLHYGFVILLTLLTLIFWHQLNAHTQSKPLFMLLMLPIVLSAILGGFGPGILATLIAVTGADLYMQPHLHTAAADSAARLQWALLGLNGLVVSLLSGYLRYSLRKLQQHRHLLSAVVAGTPDAIFIKDVYGRYQLVNDAAAHFIGLPAAEIIGRDDASLFDHKSAQFINHKDQQILASQHNAIYEEHLTTRRGDSRVFEVIKGPVFDKRGNLAGLFGISRDVTERRQFEAMLKESAVVFDNSYDGIMVVAADKSIMKINHAFSRITGYSADEVIGKTPSILASGKQGAEFYQAMWRDLERQDFWRGEIVNRRKNGELITELLSISVVRDASGKVHRYIGVFSDISRLKEHAEELDRVANYDALTGTPNRRLLSDRFHQAIARADRSGKYCAVCFLDLDGFKAVNDTYGHAAGDRLLIGVTANLKKVIRAEDTLARLGGDEFTILLSGIGSVEECHQALQRLLAAASQEVMIGTAMVQVSASIGVSLYPDDNVDPDTLLRHADQAMYQAKTLGKNRYQLFDPEQDRQVQSQRELLQTLRQALNDEQFVLYYQPKIDLVTGQVIGAEALIRWNHPEQGLLPPASFLPQIQGDKLDILFGQWVIKQALIQQAQWQQHGLSLTISVNVSAYHLTSDGFCEFLQRAIASQNVATLPTLELEILESTALDDMQQAVSIMQRCKDLGVVFSLDDFGTGYSSLTYLRQLPVKTLKIDQSFVRDMLIDKEDYQIVKGVIQLAQVFDLNVVAEGVETQQHLSALQQLGCLQAQGYGISRPMPASDFINWQQQWSNTKNWHAEPVSAGAHGYQ